MVEEMDKRQQRCPNFSQYETDILCSLVEKYKHVVENRKSDAVTWKEKDAVWNKIAAELNARAPGGHRTVKTIKKKYDLLKRNTRKKAAAIRADLYKTGNTGTTVPTLDPVEEKIKGSILLSVEGMDSEFDSDVVHTVSEDLNSELIEECNVPNITKETTISIVSTPLPSIAPIIEKSYPTSVAPMHGLKSTPTREPEPDATWDPSTRKNLKKRKNPLLHVASDMKRSKIMEIEEAKLDLINLQKKLVLQELSMKEEEEMENIKDRVFKQKQRDWAQKRHF